MAQAVRPPFILAFVADTAGCGFHRIMRPLEIMSRHGYCSGRADMVLWPEDRLRAANPEVVVFQRQLEENQLVAMQNVRAMLPDAFLIYEIDDCMSAVPDWSPHKAYIPADVDERMAAAISICDAVTVTTHPLKRHIHAIAGAHVDVRVVPNMLGRDELRRVEEVRANNKPYADRIRIGWGGGFAHSGDLALLAQAMREFHNRVEFVFLGQKPDIEVPVEFNEGVPPSDYLARLASLRLNLIVAPLTDCKFNECKSNLRLLEAAAVGVPVIASPVAPYTRDNPPIMYAEDQQQWVDTIGTYLANPEKYEKYGKQLRNWMQARFVMDDHVRERLKGWLPEGATPFVPRTKSEPHGVIIYTKDHAAVGTKYRVTSSLTEALGSDSDVLYLRQGAAVTDDMVSRLVKRLRRPNVASVAPMSNDGGAASFPRVNQFTPAEALPAAEMDKLCQEHFADVEVDVSNPAGPAVLLSRKALDVVGWPDFGFAADDFEVAMIEWGINAASKGYNHKVLADMYATVMFPHPGVKDAQGLMARCALRYPKREYPADPLAGVRTELELLYHRHFYKAPLASSMVTYAEWSALFGVVGERDMAYLQANRPNADLQLQHVTYPTTIEILLAAGDHILLSAETTKLADHALLVMERESTKVGHYGVVYADHDHIQSGGMYDNHDFKPHKLDRHMLLQRDYLTQVFAVPTALLLANVGPHEPDRILDDVALYAALVRMAWVDRVEFKHVPRVLAHVAQPDVATMMLKCEEKCLRAMAYTGLQVKPNPRFPALGEVSYAKESQNERHVLIILPTGGKMNLLEPCLQSLLAVTKHKNFRVVVVENGEPNPEASAFLDDLVTRDERVARDYVPGPYNWSKLNNEIAARDNYGDMMLFLNDDTRFVEPDWLGEMIGAALSRNDVGAVGARLLYPHGLVQHVGVVGRRGLSGHIHKGLPEGNPGYNGLAVISHEATAVTGAVMLMWRIDFDTFGGFKEELAHNFNDVDMCLRLNAAGHHNIVAARALIQHLEGATRIGPMDQQGAETLRTEANMMAGMHQEEDPYWNENLHFVHMQGGTFVSGLNYDMLEWPAKPWHWRGKDWPSDSVLIIGDDGGAWVRHAREGDIPYFAMMNGFSMQIGRPPLVNLQPFDIRDAATPRDALEKLGITKIIIRSILGGTADALPFFMKLGLPVEYMPFTGEAVCPRTDFKFQMADGNLVDCENGWRKGLCQECIMRCNSPFGFVSIAGWRDHFRRFFEDVQAITVATPEAGVVLNEVYDVQTTV